MNEVLIFLTVIGHNWLFAITTIIVIWLVVTRLVETSEAAAKLLGPLGKRIAKGYRERQAKYRQDVAQEAKLLAVELIPKVIPSDYGVVKKQLQNIIERVTELEIENSAMRAFIIFDEEWHFKDELVDAHRTGGPDPDKPTRLAWVVFLDRWKNGWRPPTLGGANSERV